MKEYNIRQVANGYIVCDNSYGGKFEYDTTERKEYVFEVFSEAMEFIQDRMITVEPGPAKIYNCPCGRSGCG